MQYRPFGKTGIDASAIAFGCGRTGGLLIDGSDADRRLAVRKALDGGINWFDTAAAYGDGKSEEALGWLLEEVPEDPFVSTKVTVNPAREDLPGQIEESLAASLKRLRRRQVTVIQLHNRIDPGAGGKALDLDKLLGADGVVFCGRSIEQAVLMGIQLEEACREHLLIAASGLAWDYPGEEERARKFSASGATLAVSFDHFARDLADDVPPSRKD